MGKCEFPGGVEIKPDGITPLDPCLYETTETYRNVTVEIRRCVRCGEIELVWHWQENSERVVGDNG